MVDIVRPKSLQSINLEQQFWRVAAATCGRWSSCDLVRRGLPTDAGTLAVEITRRLNKARPRSTFVPWNLSDADVKMVAGQKVRSRH